MTRWVPPDSAQDAGVDEAAWLDWLSWIALENPADHRSGEYWQERAAGRYHGYPGCCVEAFVADLRWGEEQRWSQRLGERRERKLYRPNGHIMCDACRDDPERADRLAAEARARRIAPEPVPWP